jgi:hypothetical protein
MTTHATRIELLKIHLALDDALGDTDVTHIESDEEMREGHPVQWAAQELMKIIDRLPVKITMSPPRKRKP